MQLVIPYHHKASTTTLLVAEKFQKRHDDVLRSVRNLECSSDFRLRNFTESSYINSQNRQMPMIIMTRDGFTLLVMSFTGSIAAKFKEDFINEFNRMEQILKNTTPVLIPTYSQRILSEPTKTVPRGFWSVFDRSHHIMFFIEKHIGSVNKYDLVDGSIGTRWAVYRKGETWATDEVFFYTHEYEDKRGDQQCKCYPYPEAHYFDDWLLDVYKKYHLYEYLHTKFMNDNNITLLEKVERILPKLLK